MPASDSWNQAGDSDAASGLGSTRTTSGAGPTDPLRRRLMLGALSAAALLPACSSVRNAPRFKSDPFMLGIASGCPRPDGIVLWTRLAPGAAGDADLGPTPIRVDWELAEDAALARIVARGHELATPELAHSIHADIRGIRPDRDYWYRFRCGDAASAIGRTRTAPAAGAAVAQFRFAFGSCQQFEQGYFVALRDIAAQAPELVVHLGDYIYESSWGQRHVRKHRGAIPTTLFEFRDRYAQYKADPDLQAAHAAAPWLVMWDDHEVANDYADDVSPVTQDPQQFLAMRAAAYQAWYEHMPVPPDMRPSGPNATIYSRFRFGDLLDVLLLDGRQYRSHHACLPGTSTAPRVDCAERHSPSRSYLGLAQERWFAEQMRQSPAHWSVIAQPTLMAEADRGAGGEHGYWMDGWDGYTASRRRTLDVLATHPTRNPLVISGDVHAFWAADLRQDNAQHTPVVATEFVGGAITSQGASAANVANMLAKNPHLRFGRADRRGYAMMTLDRKRCDVEFRAVDDEKVATSGVRTLARFSVETGAPGVQMER